LKPRGGTPGIYQAIAPEGVLIMIVLTGRLHDKISFPDFDTVIEVVALQPGTVRLGVDAPEKVRVLRDGLPERTSEKQTTLNQLNRLVDKRLEITRQGIEELRQHMELGRTEDAEAVLDKIDEELRLLRRRIRREVESLLQSDREGKTPLCRQI
jgi:sRNA-binding carbon storage regulator CsrA